MYVCVVVIAAEMLLAILSRMHFSKYKADMPKGIKWSFFRMEAGFIFYKIKGYLPIKKWEHQCRKLHVEAHEKLQERVEKYVVLRISLILFLLFATCLCTLCNEMYFRSKKGDNVLVRDDYGGMDSEQTIYLSVDDETDVFGLELKPQMLSYEQFLQRGNQLVEQLDEEILGENLGSNQVSSDLKLPVIDQEGIFALRWQSDHPDIVSSSGKVYLEALEQGRYPVCLSVVVTYEDYSLEHSFDLVVEKKFTGREFLFETVKKKIVELEEQTRGDERIELPEAIDGVSINTGREKSLGIKIMMAGTILALLIWPLSKLKNKEDISDRNTSLSEEYISFINQLWILLGAGMTLQRGFRQLVLQNQVKGLLKEELEYALHRIDMGVEESEVYDELGKQLELSEYRRFMQQVSQNVRMGTKDLRGLMEQEVQMAQELRRETAKKKGEVASTKMLFPMLLLLAVVLMIIVYPALAII